MWKQIQFNGKPCWTLHHHHPSFVIHLRMTGCIMSLFKNRKSINSAWPKHSTFHNKQRRILSLFIRVVVGSYGGRCKNDLLPQLKLLMTSYGRRCRSWKVKWTASVRLPLSSTPPSVLLLLHNSLSCMAVILPCFRCRPLCIPNLRQFTIRSKAIRSELFHYFELPPTTTDRVPCISCSFPEDRLLMLFLLLDH